jgi:hypothetical protein
MAFPSGYVLAEAQEAMTLSTVAYQGEGGSYNEIEAAIIAALASSTVLGGHLSLVWLGISPDMGTLIYVAQDDRAPNRYALVNRGTDWNFLTDWVDDFDVLHTHAWPMASPADAAIRVAQGSWDGLQAVLSAPSQPDGMTLPQLLGKISTGAAGGLDLFVTGHSLGGALATILGLYLADTASSWNAGAASVSIKTYTFASPTTGNQAYVNYYDSRSGLTNLSWQAFRVYNEQDLVPHAYADIEGIADSGIPLSLVLKLSVGAMAAVVQTVLKDNGVSYVQVGNWEPLNNNPPQAGQPSCAKEAETLDDFACWVSYEHSSLTYLGLLGVPTEGMVDHSSDMSSTASGSQGRLEARVAAVSTGRIVSGADLGHLAKKKAVARELVSKHYEVEEGLTHVYWITSPSENASNPMEPIKLLEVNENTVPSGILPLQFGPSPASGIDYPSVIVEVTPGEFARIRSGQLGLPNGWTLGAEIPKTKPEEGR